MFVHKALTKSNWGPWGPGPTLFYTRDDRLEAGLGLLIMQHLRRSGMCISSGKLTKNDGKSPFLMGKSTINGHFQ
jgi:hypothetical protein